MLTETAPAKVNLALHVLGRRPDGYHLLDSLVVFAAIGDLLTAEAAENLTLTLTGRFSAALARDTDNLVLRAARMLADAAGIAPRARLALDKRLPVASGIGGGSADAAAALRLLSRLWRLDAAPADLAALAIRIGADVPVCLAGRPARMRGIGDRLTPAPTLPACGLVLLNPGVGVATADVFRTRDGAYSLPLDLSSKWPDTTAMAAGLAGMTNDLEPPALALQPAIGDALASLRALPGCLLARMSGSGATVWALFADARAAAASVSSVSRPGWWAWGGPLAS